MNNLDKQYQALLQDILDNGVRKEDRTGTGTLSVFGRQIRHKMSDGFPLLTTKKMYFKGIVTELLWFLRGDTNIKYLVDNDCHIWDGDAYKNYEKNTPEQYVVGSDSDPMRQCMVWKRKTDSSSGYPILERLTKEEFINRIKTDDEFAKKWGDLGPVYGKQWRNWERYTPYQKIGAYEDGTGVYTYKKNTNIDQIANLIRDLKTNPDSRRLMVSAWNVGELDQMTLPPCHYGFQVYTRELSLDERTTLFCNKTGQKDWKERVQATIEVQGEENLNKEFEKHNIPTRAISLMWNQRSVDTFLGLPFNIASYGLLLEIIAKEVNMVPDELIGNLGDTHLYLNHIEQAKEQIGRELNLDERYDLMPLITGHAKENIEQRKFINNFQGNTPGVSYHEEWLDSFNIPKRTREPYPLPELMICGDMRRTDGFTVPFDELDHSLIKLINYQSHPAIKAPLSN